MMLQRQKAEDCQDACTMYEDCQYFTYNVTSKLCYLKNIMRRPSPPKVVRVPGVISGYTKKGCSTQEACDEECAYLVLENVDMSGDIIGRCTAADPDNCQLICTDHPRCEYFTFGSDGCQDEDMRYTCLLKVTCGGKLPEVVPSHGIFSGYSLRHARVGEKTCSHEVYQDIDFPGNDQRKLEVKKWSHCQDECSKDALCIYWSFVTEKFPQSDLHGTCYLKNVMGLPNPPQITEESDLVSGFSEIRCTEHLTEYYSEEMSSEYDSSMEEDSGQKAEAPAPQEMVLPQEPTPVQK
ncbi:coagulation factor XI-like [Ambystoma mexicanum]|uniref:coagulation factor XI-like n=1 Tax=Ambystoma mexicanum TaxID=8296 RepID=UPI0037E6F808